MKTLQQKMESYLVRRCEQDADFDPDEVAQEFVEEYKDELQGHAASWLETAWEKAMEAAATKVERDMAIFHRVQEYVDRGAVDEIPQDLLKDALPIVERVAGKATREALEDVWRKSDAGESAGDNSGSPDGDE